MKLNPIGAVILIEISHNLHTVHRSIQNGAGNAEADVSKADDAKSLHDGFSSFPYFTWEIQTKGKGIGKEGSLFFNKPA